MQWASLHCCAVPRARSDHCVSCLSGPCGWSIPRQYVPMNHISHLYLCSKFSPGAWRADVRALVLGFPGSMADKARGCGVGMPARVAAMNTKSLEYTCESLDVKQLPQLSARTPQPPLPPCVDGAAAATYRASWAIRTYEYAVWTTCCLWVMFVDAGARCTHKVVTFACIRCRAHTKGKRSPTP